MATKTNNTNKRYTINVLPFQKNIHILEKSILFYFQVRKSPDPLNIPTPTPAPDGGGPVACLSGPAAC